MKVNATILASAVALAGLMLGGCVVEERTTVREERPVVVERPAPVVVERPGPVVVEQPQEIIVRRPRPVEIVERVGPVRPGEIWVKGYYRPRGDNWEWVAGHAERPPRAGAVWVEPRYETRGANEVHVTLGFWR